MKKNPLLKNADQPARLLPRDLMVGTAILALFELGLGGAAAAMDGISGDVRLDGMDGLDATGSKARPAGESLAELAPDASASDPVLSGLPAAAGRTAPAEHRGAEPFIEPPAGLASSRLAPDEGDAFIAPGLTQPAGTGRIPLPDPVDHAGLIDPAGASGTITDEPAADPPPDTPSPPGTTTPVPANWGDRTVRIGSDGEDTIIGFGLDDYIQGRDGDDLIIGGAGQDRLFGGNGRDILFGNDGQDYLIGGDADDLLTGGTGADTFVFHPGFGRDRVTDFNTLAEHDVVEVSRREFADFAAVLEHLTETALGTVLTLHDGSTLTLENISKSSLTAHDFHFEV